MRRFIVSCSLMMVLFFACKAKQKNMPAQQTKTAMDSIPFSSSGKVSHKYSASGCGAVIISYKNPQHDTLTLIPMTPLNEFDKEGLEILFNYRTLRVHQPKGCGAGIPVQITGIRAK